MGRNQTTEQERVVRDSTRSHDSTAMSPPPLPNCVYSKLITHITAAQSVSPTASSQPTIRLLPTARLSHSGSCSGAASCVEVAFVQITITVSPGRKRQYKHAYQKTKQKWEHDTYNEYNLL